MFMFYCIIVWNCVFFSVQVLHFLVAFHTMTVSALMKFCKWVLYIERFACSICKWKWWRVLYFWNTRDRVEKFTENDGRSLCMVQLMATNEIIFICDFNILSISRPLEKVCVDGWLRLCLLLSMSFDWLEQRDMNTKLISFK